jgi:beta-phosphoglucomutase-like phosphatase (HAD superfamily)
MLRAGISGSFSLTIAPPYNNGYELATKPAPDLYVAALSWFDMKPSDYWIAFEDSDSGVEAAKASSSQVIVHKVTYAEMQERLRKCEF